MAFTRKFLSALGIEADKQDEIISAHAEVVDALKNERDTYKAQADKMPEIQKQLDEAKEKAAKHDGEEVVSKAEYDKILKEYNELTAKETKASKQAAYRELLKDAGVSEKRFNAILKVTDVDSIELDKDGKIKDAENYTKNIKTDWADFIPEIKTEGAKTPNPPQGKQATDLGSLSMEEYIAARKKG